MPSVNTKSTLSAKFQILEVSSCLQPEYYTVLPSMDINAYLWPQGKLPETPGRLYWMTSQGEYKRTGSSIESLTHRIAAVYIEKDEPPILLLPLEPVCAETGCALAWAVSDAKRIVRWSI